MRLDRAIFDFLLVVPSLSPLYLSLVHPFLLSIKSHPFLSHLFLTFPPLLSFYLSPFWFFLFFCLSFSLFLSFCLTYSLSLSICRIRYAYESQAKVEVRVARIFNTFGPRMHPNDGRVVSNFIIQVFDHSHLVSDILNFHFLSIWC